MIYLGEWHTHNELNPTPSPRDKNMIKNMLKDSKMEIDFLILIIVGEKNNYIGVQSKSSLKELPASLNPFFIDIF